MLATLAGPATLIVIVILVTVSILYLVFNKGKIVSESNIDNQATTTPPRYDDTNISLKSINVESLPSEAAAISKSNERNPNSKLFVDFNGQFPTVTREFARSSPYDGAQLTQNDLEVREDKLLEELESEIMQLCKSPGDKINVYIVNSDKMIYPEDTMIPYRNILSDAKLMEGLALAKTNPGSFDAPIQPITSTQKTLLNEIGIETTTTTNSGKNILPLSDLQILLKLNEHVNNIFSNRQELKSNRLSKIRAVVYKVRSTCKTIGGSRSKKKTRKTRTNKQTAGQQLIPQIKLSPKSVERIQKFGIFNIVKAIRWKYYSQNRSKSLTDVVSIDRIVTLIITIALLALEEDATAYGIVVDQIMSSALYVKDDRFMLLPYYLPFLR